MLSSSFHQVNTPESIQSDARLITWRHMGGGGKLKKKQLQIGRKQITE